MTGTFSYEYQNKEQKHAFTVQLNESHATNGRDRDNVFENQVHALKMDNGNWISSLVHDFDLYQGVPAAVEPQSVLIH